MIEKFSAKKCAQVRFNFRQLSTEFWDYQETGSINWASWISRYLDATIYIKNLLKKLRVRSIALQNYSKIGQKTEIQ